MNTSPAFAEIVTNSVDVLLNQIPPPERTDQSLEKKLSLIKKRVSEFFEQLEGRDFAAALIRSRWSQPDIQTRLRNGEDKNSILSEIAIEVKRFILFLKVRILPVIKNLFVIINLENRILMRNKLEDRASKIRAAEASQVFANTLYELVTDENLPPIFEELLCHLMTFMEKLSIPDTQFAATYVGALSQACLMLKLHQDGYTLITPEKSEIAIWDVDHGIDLVAISSDREVYVINSKSYVEMGRSMTHARGFYVDDTTLNIRRLSTLPASLVEKIIAETGNDVEAVVSVHVFVPSRHKSGANLDNFVGFKEMGELNLPKVNNKH